MSGDVDCERYLGLPCEEPEFSRANITVELAPDGIDAVPFSLTLIEVIMFFALVAVVTLLEMKRRSSRYAGRMTWRSAGNPSRVDSIV